MSTFLAIDIISHALRFILVGVGSYSNFITTQSALAAVALSFFIGSLFGRLNLIWYCRLAKGVRSKTVTSVAFKHWSYGKWLLAENFAFIAST
jgi:hypothetical protein